MNKNKCNLHVHQGLVQSSQNQACNDLHRDKIDHMMKNDMHTPFELLLTS